MDYSDIDPLFGSMGYGSKPRVCIRKKLGKDSRNMVCRTSTMYAFMKSSLRLSRMWYRARRTSSSATTCDRAGDKQWKMWDVNVQENINHRS